jgi:hypothetical protein
MTIRFNIGAIGLAVILAGCGGPTVGPDEVRAMVVPATGKLVGADGRPVANAWVVFNPQTIPGHEANAPTGPDGTFRLSTFGKEDGAIPGNYVVTVEPHPYAKGPKPNIQRRYSSSKDSPLKVEITKDGSGDLGQLTLR